MKIKKIYLLTFVFLGAFFAGSFFVTPSTAQAYKCPNGEVIAGNGDFTCYKWVDTDIGKAKEGNSNANGDKTYTCDTGTLRGDRCFAPRAQRTNSVPTYDDGTPVEKNNFGCKAGYNYYNGVGKNKGKCIEDNDCDPTDQDGYQNCIDNLEVRDPIVITPEAETAQGKCVANGGKWTTPQSGNGGSCANTEASCKNNGEIFVKGTCQSNPEKACTTQFPSTSGGNRPGPPAPDTNLAARNACIAGAKNPDENCDAKPNQAEKDACNQGKKMAKDIEEAAKVAGAAQGERQRDQGDSDGCGKAKTNLISCDGEGVAALGSVLKIALFVLTVIVGIAAVGGVVYGAILYASAEDNASQTGKAKTLIREVVIGLFLYGFMIAIVNWLVPGGVIG